MWTESLSVQFNNGYYATVLGTDEINNPLDSDTLASYPLYLEVQLDANAPMSPRQSVNSAPYAQIAGMAESVEGGTVSADEIYIGTDLVIDGNGVWQGAALTPDWNNIQTIPPGFADQVDDVLTSTQVENHIQNAQGLNLSTSTTVGGQSIVTSATTLLPDWSNIQSIPPGFSDNTDNTLSPSEVEQYIESSTTVNLNANTQIGGAAILTPNSNLNWNNLQNVPTGLADGDELDILDASCAGGEIVSWTGSNWACVSDNTLSVSEVGSYVANNAYNLNANTTINNATILTDADNTLVGLGMSCQDNDIARYDASIGEWFCDIDIELSETQVENYINNAPIDLAFGSQVNGSNIVTTATDSDTLGGLNCSTDEIAKYNGSAWVCATESVGAGAGLPYTAIYQRTATSSGTPFAQCDDNDDVLLHGGCNSSAVEIWGSYPESTTDSTTRSGWKCYAGNKASLRMLYV